MSTRKPSVALFCALIVMCSISMVVTSSFTDSYAQTDGNTWYIDASNGNDNNAGTLEQPWKSISKISVDDVKDGDTVMITGEFSTLGLTKLVRIEAYGDGASFSNSAGVRWNSITEDGKPSGTISFVGITFYNMTIQDEGASSYNLSDVNIYYENCHFFNKNSAMSLVLYGNYSVEVTNCDFNGTNVDTQNNLYTNSTYAIFANNCSNLAINNCVIEDYTRAVNADSIGYLEISDTKISIDVTINRGTPDTEIRQIQIAGTIGDVLIDNISISSTVGGNAVSVHETTDDNAHVVLTNSSISGFKTGIIYQVADGTWAQNTVIMANGNYFKDYTGKVSAITASTTDNSVNVSDFQVINDIFYTNPEMTETNINNDNQEEESLPPLIPQRSANNTDVSTYIACCAAAAVVALLAIILVMNERKR